MMRLWAAMLVGCYEGREPPRPTHQGTTDPTGGLEFAVPLGPTDPLVVGTAEGPEQPIVVDSAGGEVALEPWSPLSGLPASGWVPEGGWAPGSYEVTGVVGSESRQRAAFTVGAFGVAPLDPQTLVGRTWVATSHWSPWEPALAFVGEQRTAGLVVESVEGEELTFWVLGQIDGQWCAVLHDTGAISADGSRLDWIRPELAGAATDGTAVTGYDLAVTVGWAADPRHAWATGAGLLDTRNVGALAGLGTASDSVCVLLHSFGGTCRACPDGEEVCTDLEAEAVDLWEIDPLDPTALPLCGLDPVGDVSVEIPPISCDFDPIEIDCGCRTVGVQGGLPLLIAAGFVGLRRPGRRSGTPPGPRSRPAAARPTGPATPR